MSAASHLKAAAQPAQEQVFSHEIAMPAKSPALIVRNLRLLWERRRFLLRSAVAGVVLGVLLAFVIPPRFDSQTQLMPPDAQSGSGMAMAAMAMAGGNSLAPIAGTLLGMKSSGALFMGILRSRTVEDRIVDRFALRQVYGESLERDARRQLEENSSISEDRNSGIISITVSDRDPKRAAAIAQAYVEELDHLVAELSTSAAHRERVFLEERLRSVKQELDDASRDFSQFQSSSATLDIKEQGRAMFDAAATLSGQLIAAESELKGLEAIYTVNNVRVQAIQARIAELRRQLLKMGGRAEAGGGNSAESGDVAYPTIRKLPLLGLTYSDLYRQTKIKETVYETLTRQYELAKVEEAKETPAVKVLDVAKVPEKKSFPPRSEIVFLCAILLLLGASGIALGQERWRETEAEDPGKTLALEVLQTVNVRMPWAPPNGSRVQALTHKIWVRFAPKVRLSADQPDIGNVPQVLLPETMTRDSHE